MNYVQRATDIAANKPRDAGGPTPDALPQRRLRVLQVVEATFAGVGRHVLDLCAELLVRGHEVHLAYASARMEERFRMGVENLRDLRTYQLDMARGPSPYDGRAVLLLRRYIREHGPFDVIHGHSSKGGAIARLAAVGVSARRVYTAHALRTMDSDLPAIERMLYAAAERLLGILLTDAFIGVAKEEAQEAIRLGLACRRLHVVPNGIAPPTLPDRTTVRSRYGLGDGQICLMWVGRLAPQKAPERFVRLFASLADEAPEIQAVMIGSGPLEAYLLALIHDLGLSGRLQLVQDQHAIHSMPAADVYVMTSRYEGLPYVLLEAQSTGLPVVAFEVGGLAIAIENGATGFAIAQEDEAGFLDALRRLIRDPGLRSVMGHAARRHSARFRLDLMVDRVEAIYQSLSGNQLRPAEGAD